MPIVKNVQDGQYVVIKLASNTTETDTMYDLPKGHIIYPWEMYLCVDQAHSNKAIDIGIGMSTETGYDSDGFVAAASIGTAGIYVVSNLYTATDGTNQNYLSVRKIGALFFGGLNGSNAAGDAGIYALKAYIGDGVCKSICYTCSSGTSTFKGRLIFRTHYLPFYEV